MELTKRMVSSTGQTAYLVNDGGETYPIFEESLHSKIIFDALIASGYEFCSMPFGFKKDGKAISAMAQSDWNITPVEEGDMFDMLDADRYDTQELMGMVTEESTLYIPEPETTYTINTREEFLEFLQLFHNDDAFAEFRPINSFVHPDARFTVEEYRGGKFKEYVDILSNYRMFNFHRWKRLIEWINKPLQSFDDVLREYFKWGLDGLYMPLTADYEKQLSTPEFTMYNAEDRWSALFYRKEVGLIDNVGTLLLPPESENLRWEYVYSKEYINNKIKTLKPNEVTIVNLKTPVKETCFVKDGKDMSLHITQSSIYLGKALFSPLRVYPNGMNMRAAMPEYCTPNRFNDMAEDAYIYALAVDTLRNRVAPCSATSAKALELMGLTKRCILNYYVNKIDMSKGESEDGVVSIDWNDVNSYCNGAVEEGPLKDYLDGILSGMYNLDSIKSAIDVTSRYNAKSLYEQIYVLHKIFGLSIDEIKEKINSMGDSDSFTVTRDDGYFFTFTQPINRDMFTAFNLDVQNYRVQASQQAVEWIYVLEAARELGPAEAKRHVAMSCYSVNRLNSKVKMLSSVIEDKFEKEVRSKFTNELEIASWMKDATYFAACKYFEAALKGTITYPAQLGGRIEQVDADLRNQLYSTLNLKVDMLSAICEGNVYSDEFHFFFANAYVTPTQIIPLKNATIKQVDLAAVWRDYSNNPSATATLVERGAIPASGFTAWELWALDPNYTLLDHDGIGNDDLYGYYMNSLKYLQELPNNVKYEKVPHPVEYLFPALYGKSEEDEENEDDTLPAGQERTEAPKFSVTSMKDIHMDDYKELLDISGERNDGVVFKPYLGLNSDDFYSIRTPEEALSRTVPMGSKGINVMLPDKFCFSDGVIHDYKELPQYVDKDTSILNIQGREYIVRDYRGTYYRVEV